MPEEDYSLQVLRQGLYATPEQDLEKQPQVLINNCAEPTEEKSKKKRTTNPGVRVQVTLVTFDFVSAGIMIYSVEEGF